MEIRCLTRTIFKPNVQNGIARCDKTLNQFTTKAGEVINEVICDYGKGLITKSEVQNNKIIQTLTNGDVITYTKNHVGDVLVTEGKTQTINRNPKLWDNLLGSIFKGI